MKNKDHKIGIIWDFKYFCGNLTVFFFSNSLRVMWPLDSKIHTWCYRIGRPYYYLPFQPLSCLDEWRDKPLGSHVSTASTRMPSFVIFFPSSLLLPSWTSDSWQPTSYFNILNESLLVKSLTRSRWPKVTSLWWRGSSSSRPLSFGTLPSFQEHMLGVFHTPVLCTGLLTPRPLPSCLFVSEAVGRVMWTVTAE